MSRTHRVQIGRLTIDLPVINIADDGAPPILVALFDSQGKWEINREAAALLAKKMPDGVEAILMPGGKAEGLLQAMGEETRLPTYVARKERKKYMGKAVSHTVQTITTQRTQTLNLSETSVAELHGKRVLMLDDVVSTGGSVDAIKGLLKDVGAECVGVMAVFTEGTRRPEVITLGHLPLFD